MIVRDALRLSWGTFSNVKVKPPAKVDAKVTRLALTLSFIPASFVAMVAWLCGFLAYRATHTPLVAATIVVGIEIALTAGIHIDGLMDTADGGAILVKAGRVRALEVMKSGSSGPAGIVTLLIAIILQVTALATAFTGHRSGIWIIAALLGRLAIVLSCRRGAKSARPDGLGNPFIGVLSPALLATTTVIYVAVMLALGISTGTPALNLFIAGAIGLGFGELLRHRSDKQFGGLTGDVLGSILEKARTAALLVLIIAR